MKLIEQAIQELMLKENRSIEWGSLIDIWEMALREDRGHTRSLDRNTIQDYIAILRSYSGHLLKRLATEISPADIREIFVNMESQGRAIRSQKKFKTAFNMAYTYGIHTRKIPNVSVSPGKDVQTVGRKQEFKPNVLNLPEIKTLLKKAKEVDHEWYPIWATALHTGCRAGELYALEWTDIDFESKRIKINKSFNKKQNKIGPTKAGTWREIPINGELEVILKELKMQRGQERYVLRGVSWKAYGQSEILKAFCKEIGVPEIRFHDLRACFATQLLKNGIAPTIVMKICGWKDLKTMQCYTRLAGVEINDATNALKFIPQDQVMGALVELFDSNSKSGAN